MKTTKKFLITIEVEANSAEQLQALLSIPYEQALATHEKFLENPYYNSIKPTLLENEQICFSIQANAEITEL